ncbi:MAG: hypothetical protein HWN68_14320 [Desulfobacterales bacterium]|nr:hypothetical protein [Desulfobacterales bacterium]
MKCPHCNSDLPSRQCRQCREMTPLSGKFCCHCGAAFNDVDIAEPIASGAESDGGGIDFSKRRLCSDGACIGVINEQGVCSECGKPYTGEAE